MMTAIVLAGVLLTWIGATREQSQRVVRFESSNTIEARLPTSIAWSPEGHHLGLLTPSGLAVYEPSSTVPIQTFRSARVTQFSWRHDGKFVVGRTLTDTQNRSGQASLTLFSVEDGSVVELLHDVDAADPQFDSTGSVHFWNRDSGVHQVIKPGVARPSRDPGDSKHRSQRLVAVRHPGEARPTLRIFDTRTGARDLDRKDSQLAIPRLFLDAFPRTGHFLVAIEGHDAWHTAIISADGTLIRDLGPRMPGRFAGYSVSADGNKVLGVLARGDNSESADQPLAIMDLRDGTISRVQGAESASFPQFSRDGAFVAYWDPRSGRTHVGTLAIQ